MTKIFQNYYSTKYVPQFVIIVNIQSYISLNPSESPMGLIFREYE